VIGLLLLIWGTPLPSAFELYTIAEDSSEKTNLADSKPQIVAKLQDGLKVTLMSAIGPKQT
jgi:arylsulfatase B